MFYATRGVHWCNKKNHDEHRGVNHSQLMLPFKTCIRKAREPGWWRDRKLEIARVARADPPRTRRVAHTAKSLHVRSHAVEYEILSERAITPRSRSPSQPLSLMRLSARAHTSPSMPRRPRCDAVRCSAAWRQRSRLQSVGMEEAKDYGCG